MKSIRRLLGMDHQQHETEILPWKQIHIFFDNFAPKTNNLTYFIGINFCGYNFRGFRGFSKNSRKFVPAKKVRQTLISGNFDMQSLVSVLSCENAFNLHESTGLLV